MSETLTHDASSPALEGYRLLREECGVLASRPISIITLTGEDRKGWLQGQVTNDLRKLDLGASSAFCFCQPTGQILAVCEVWSIRDRFLLTFNSATLQAVMARIEQMVILEDVQAKDLSEDYTLVSIQGPTATRSLSDLMTLPSLDGGESRYEDAEVFVLRSNRTGFGGWDVWIRNEDQKAIKALRKRFPQIDEEAYNIARLEWGIPRHGVDWNEKTLPPELGANFENRHISYNKGCYTGQEVIMRIHSRGHTNRTWVGLLADDMLEPGATITHPTRKDAGTVTSVADSPEFGPIGAAMVRNEIAENGELVQIETSRGTIEAEIRMMPLLRFE